MSPWPISLDFRLIRPRLTVGLNGPALHSPARVLRDDFASPISVSGREVTLDLAECHVCTWIRFLGLSPSPQESGEAAPPVRGLLQFTPAVPARGPHLRRATPPTVSVTLDLPMDAKDPLVQLALSRDNRVALHVQVLGMEVLDRPQPMGALRWNDAEITPLIVADGSVLIEPRRRPREG